MTRLNQFAKVFCVVVCLGTLFSAAGAFAQDATAMFRGKVNLPFETRWGNAVLPAGEYSLSVRSSTLPALLTVRGKKASVIVQAQSLSTRNDSGTQSYLLIAKWRRGVVRSLYVSELGMTFNYAAPKEDTKAMTQEAVLIQRLPVTKAQQ